METNFDFAIILSAGLGTRMGEIGRLMPKVMWPIFNKPLLELQIEYAISFGIKKIFINTHFLHLEIEKYIEKNITSYTKKGIEIQLLHERNLLDSGGAIHNLACAINPKYKGNLLMINGDQFLMMPKSEMDSFQLAFMNSNVRALLLSIDVLKGSKYNELILDERNMLLKIGSAPVDRDYITYSGVGAIRLDGLKQFLGATKFFETVANYKQESIQIYKPSQFEYWDFGTSKIYFENMFKLANEVELESCLFAKFLKAADIKLNDGNFISTEKKAIDLNASGTFIAQSIHFNGTIQSP